MASDGRRRSGDRGDAALTREALIAVVGSGPLLPADAIVVLSGDGTSRCDVALQLLAQEGAPLIVVTGNLDAPPFSLTAKRLEAYLLGKGVAPSRIVRLQEGTNTREEADAVVRLVKAREWGRITVVTSAFHTYRAFLTFVKALSDAGLERKTDVRILPASQQKWSDVPKGLKKTRLELLADEWVKISEYQTKGDVASYDEGLDYYLHWERAA